MKTVIVGSHNPVKLETTKEAFALIFPEDDIDFLTFDAPSGVPDQPFGSDETKLGAQNRAAACKNEFPNADFWVGLEGGLEKDDKDYWAFAWMCIEGKDNKTGFGRTGSFLLPPEVSKLVGEGQELGHATDAVFDETNSKHKGGTIGILTNDLIGRKDFYRDALIFALVPFIKKELYPSD